jgi:hypothetical protein
MIGQHLVNGLETSWALATVTWLLVFAFREDARGLGLLAGTAPFVRPELFVLGSALLAWQTFKTANRRRVLWTGAALAPLPWLILSYSQTGSVVPSSLGAKQAWYAEGCWTAAQRAKVVGSGLLGWLSAMPVVALGAAGLWRTAVGRVALGSAAITLTVWAFSVPNVLHSYQRHRYFAVFLPLLVGGLAQLPRWLRPAVVAAAAAMAALSIASIVRFEPAAIADAMAVRRGINDALARDGASRVLLHDAGYLAYSDGIRTGIDMVGLKTPRAMALHQAFTGPTCGVRRDEALSRLAAESRPTHLVVWQPWDDFFHVTAALAGGGWHASRLATVGGAEPVQVYRLTPGE